MDGGYNSDVNTVEDRSIIRCDTRICHDHCKFAGQGEGPGIQRMVRCCTCMSWYHYGCHNIDETAGAYTAAESGKPGQGEREEDRTATDHDTA